MTIGTMSVSVKVIIIIILAIGICLLYTFNPENILWFPKCWFFRLTGLQCPACGTQRALYQLLHLHVVSAFWYNPFAIISLPYASMLVIVRWFDLNNRLQRLSSFCYHPVTVRLYLVLIILWWILRNII